MATAERSMTELGFTAMIKDLEAETKALYEQRRALRDLAFNVQSFCPGGANGTRASHEWNVVRADDCAVFGGGSVRSAEFECACGATMSIADGQSKVGG
jgi:hypothetical protein